MTKNIDSVLQMLSEVTYFLVLLYAYIGVYIFNLQNTMLVKEFISFKLF